MDKKVRKRGGREGIGPHCRIQFEAALRSNPDDDMILSSYALLLRYISPLSPLPISDSPPLFHGRLSLFCSFHPPKCIM